MAHKRLTDNINVVIAKVLRWRPHVSQGQIATLRLEAAKQGGRISYERAGRIVNGDRPGRVPIYSDDGDQSGFAADYEDHLYRVEQS